MIYPEFIKKDGTIGITSLSAGCGHKVEEYENSLVYLKNHGYKIKETKSVRKDKLVAASAKTRAKELDQLITDKDVDMIMLAAGGDLQIETIPHINYDNIAKNPKWITGLSDPTNLLYLVTTSLDIATIYGFNGGGFDNTERKDQENNLEIIKGHIVKQKSYDHYQTFLDEIQGIDKTHKVKWLASDKQLHFKGRCIGGCIDCIAKIIGTRFDHTQEFIEKYKDDGIIWYFDNFALSAYNLYMTLLQFSYAGYFEHCKGVIIGRNAFPSTQDSEVFKKYDEVYKKFFKDIPYIYEADIGHTKPRITMINGALADIRYKDHKGEISFKLK